MFELWEYLTKDGKSPFEEWFLGLKPQGQARIATRLDRIANGLLTDVKSVGEGVQEYRIHGQNPFRLYFGHDGNEVIILLIGGTKHRQSADIKTAKDYWLDYKESKRKVEYNDPAS